MSNVCSTPNCANIPVESEDQCLECLMTVRHIFCQVDGCNNSLKSEDEQTSGECDPCWASTHQIGSGVGSSVKSWSDPVCTHKGTPEVFTIGAGFVKAGGDRDMFSWDLSGVDMIVNLTGMPNNKVTWDDGVAKLLGPDHDLLQRGTPEMLLRWTDSQAPPVSMLFFSELASVVQSGTNIMIHCMGGHGRTGTALVALAHAAELHYSSTDPVKWIREIYCKKSVETSTQIDWLKKIGVKTKSKGSHFQELKNKEDNKGKNKKGSVQKWLEAKQKQKDKKGKKKDKHGVWK